MSVRILPIPEESAEAGASGLGRDVDGTRGRTLHEL